MTSILLSSDDQSTGEKLAKKLARDLGWEHLGLSFLEIVADTHKTTEEKLLKALTTPPSSMVFSSKSLEQHRAYIQMETLRRLLDDSIVCEGLGTHLFVRGVSHIMTVRVLSDTRVREEKVVQRKSIPPKKARKEIDRETANRISWSKKTYSLDESDASLYDMVISLEQIDETKALEVIGNMAEYRKFKPMTYSRKCVEDLALAAELRVALLPKFTDFQVVADGSTVTVRIKCPKRQKAKTAGEIKVIANEIPPIKFVEVHAVNKLIALSGEKDSKSAS